MEFTLNDPVGFEESLTCEFKEAKTQPVQAIGKIVDQYVVAFLNAVGGSIYWGIRDLDRVVTGVPTSEKVRDELKQVIGQKLAAIAPPFDPSTVEVPFHRVRDSMGNWLADTRVLEVRVRKPEVPNLFLTGSGEAYRRTIGGIKKLSGAELYAALAVPLQSKIPKHAAYSLVARLPTVLRRASLVETLIRGRRVLWVDDHPSNNFHERVALAEMGITVDVAASSAEGMKALRVLRPDVIVSDIHRDGDEMAGLEFLRMLRDGRVDIPVVFYVGSVAEDRGIPPGAFDITDRPDEVLHLVLDVLERSAGERGQQSP